MIAALFVAASLAVPGNFLLYEKAAAKKDPNPEHSWNVSGKKTAQLVVDPCQKARLGLAGRTAARTIVYTAVPDYSKSEQVILYSSPEAAAKAVGELRTAVRTCGTAGYRYSQAKVALGDEAVLVTGQAYDHGKPAVGGERAVVARRANALILYTVAGEWGKPAKADFSRQRKDAGTMLAKICELAEC
ncbi:hypothetical protein ACFFV7_19335 [Nonomuraea spiralis]|uniref:PknH-like extracellular domain-containing protein n=1 Tax=Nonomuraea spiralis TaxID=46182 RepID=A0ABV5IHZ4_9ACTN|nr:hypothetical protein [Nonomuraea spiralis]GGS72253.1 hypothetical protein GCM10010176_014170 [Nonomuraea spiralis]